MPVKTLVGDNVATLLQQAQAAIGPDAVKPEKLFLVWNAADWIYRRQRPAEQQWSIEQLMEADLQDMKKKWYLEPLIAKITD